MLEKTDLLLEGAELILRHMPGGRAVIGIENNKPKAIEKIKADAAAKGSKLEVLELKSRYPQGAEKVSFTRPPAVSSRRASSPVMSACWS